MKIKERLLDSQAAFIFGGTMFLLRKNLKFITINQDYLKYLHDCCPEVYYKPTGYERKPYIGILVQESDSDAEKKYKVLLNIEYSFCLKIIDSVINKASRLYEKQIRTKKVIKFCCDFRLLEEKCREYH